MKFQTIIVFALLICIAKISFAQNEEIKPHKYNVKVKVPTFKKKILTYPFKEGDSVKISFTKVKSSLPNTGGYLNNDKISSFEKTQAAKLPDPATKLKGADSLVNTNELLGKGGIGQFSFTQQGAGPLFQGNNLPMLEKTFYINQTGNYSLIFKNKSLLPKTFAVEITQMPKPKPVVMLDTVKFDTIATVIFSKELNVSPKLNISQNSSYVIPISYPDLPNLLGISYAITTDTTMTSKLTTNEPGTYDTSIPSKAFGIDKIEVSSSQDPDIKFHLLYNGVQVPLSQDQKHFGAINPYEIINKDVNLYVENRNKINYKKIYIKMISYHLHLKENETSKP
ncbi:hypothetical protein [Aureibacter tunicatorum]|uniref:Uncharacterized protein n=1 Tax=Aureibacter tunicatorum TaxID=866807 RepID=A0AAE3XQI5_9BACT|nr:hypothetical protein [Aureibacter tunicatorum]MDR6240785.1 hypothetical protein [Aureibacter tunicatorum]BDD06882.1 hypothetical protein AUTU_43650 [Aureibacter tunicatorum]